MEFIETNNYSTKRLLTLSIIGVFTCTLSILGSCSIIKLAWPAWKQQGRQRRQRQQQQQGRHPYHFIMIVLSLCDILFSLSFLLQPFTTPSLERFSFGTLTSCTIIGFTFNVSRVMGAIQNSTLSFYFLLTLRYGWSLNKIKKQFLQWPIILLTTMLPLSLGIAGIITKSFNPYPTAAACTFESSPPLCTDPNNDIIECKRGEASSLLANIQFVIITIASISGFIATLLVYLAVRKTFYNSTKYSFERRRQEQQSGNESSMHFQIRTNDNDKNKDDNNNNATMATTPTTTRTTFDAEGQQCTTTTTIIMTNSERRRMKQLRQVGRQSVLYSLVYLNQFMWPLMIALGRLLFSEQLGTKKYFIFSVFIWTFYPLQGFFNFLVYIRPYYLKRKIRYSPELTTFQIFCLCLKGHDYHHPNVVVDLGTNADNNSNYFFNGEGWRNRAGSFHFSSKEIIMRMKKIHFDFSFFPPKNYQTSSMAPQENQQHDTCNNYDYKNGNSNNKNNPSKQEIIIVQEVPPKEKEEEEHDDNVIDSHHLDHILNLGNPMEEIIEFESWILDDVTNGDDYNDSIDNSNDISGMDSTLVDLDNKGAITTRS